MIRSTQNARTFSAAPKCALAALFLLAAGSALWAQSYQGGVRGTVNDQQGAAIPAAKVTLTNTATGESRAAVTNGSGGFDFTSLVPSTYMLVVESPSFKKFERKNVIVGTQEELTIDVKLEVGSVSESVQVTEEVPLIESSNASQGPGARQPEARRAAESRPQPVHAVEAGRRT